MDLDLALAYYDSYDPACACDTCERHRHYDAVVLALKRQLDALIQARNCVSAKLCPHVGRWPTGAERRELMREWRRVCSHVDTHQPAIEDRLDELCPEDER
jgi:hypothetical protein